jgi:cysteine desulfurase
LLAIGLKPHEAHGSLRLSIGRWTTKEEVNYVLKILPEAVERLRKISPYKGGW